MDVHALKFAFEHILLWMCCVGLAATCLGLLALGVSRLPVRIRAAADRYGRPSACSQPCAARFEGMCCEQAA